MKKTNKKQAAAWLLSLLPLVMIAAVYRRLPAEVPMHWDLDGAVDYGAKAQLWVIAAMAPVLEAMFCFLPKIDPKNKNYGKFGDAYLGIQLVTLLFLAAITGICITEALRPGTVNVSGVVCLLVSLMMVYLGNVMPRFRMNWYCGVKNPWTLSSEAVWTRTHRIAGRMFFASGLLGAAAQPLGVAAGEGRFLGKVHAISKGGLDALHSQFSALVLIAAALGCQLIRVNDDAKVSALGPQRAGQTGFSCAVHAADNRINLHTLLPFISLGRCRRRGPRWCNSFTPAFQKPL